MQVLFYVLALVLQNPSTPSPQQPPVPSKMPPVPDKLLPQAVAPTKTVPTPAPPIQATPQASVQSEVLGPEQVFRCNQDGQSYVGQQVLQGPPERQGRWVAKYKVKTDQGKQVYRASGYGDPYGFVQWLNNYRAANGRGPVGYDPGLSGQAAVNNSYGFGHSYMGSARRQNAGMGDGGTVWQMWTTSPAHNDALLDPTITRVGIAANGSIWTYNAY